MVLTFTCVFFCGTGLVGWKSGLAATFSFSFCLFEDLNPVSFSPLCLHFVLDDTYILGVGKELSVSDKTC